MIDEVVYFQCNGETLKSVVQSLLWWIGFLEQIDGWKFAYANSI